jgi:TRAP-type C4-dicarboxylate transport system permease large subunit
MKAAKALNQAGYLWEIPLLAIFVVVVGAVIGPRLPDPWRFVVYAVIAVAVVAFLFYNFVFPGWLPGKRRRGSDS